MTLSTARLPMERQLQKEQVNPETNLPEKTAKCINLFNLINYAYIFIFNHDAVWS